MYGFERSPSYRQICIVCQQQTPSGGSSRGALRRNPFRCVDGRFTLSRIVSVSGLQNDDYQFSESASVVSHNPSTDLDSASAYQSYGQDEGDAGGVTSGFEGLR